MADHSGGRVRRIGALSIGALGALSYNWWLEALVVPGLAPSPNGFFSDLEASGLRDSTYLQHADVFAGACWIVALVLRGSLGPNGERRGEWPWLIIFCACGIVGGVFVYACPEGASAVCRNLEWHLKLPLHHYIHMLAGIAEFASATIALFLASRRQGAHSEAVSLAFRPLFRALVVAYPLLGVSYLTDRLGEVLEPIFFLSFTAIIALELLESRGARVGQLVGAPRGEQDDD